MGRHQRRHLPGGSRVPLELLEGGSGSGRDRDPERHVVLPQELAPPEAFLGDLLRIQPELLHQWLRRSHRSACPMGRDVVAGTGQRLLRGERSRRLPPDRDAHHRNPLLSHGVGLCRPRHFASLPGCARGGDPTGGVLLARAGGGGAGALRVRTKGRRSGGEPRGPDGRSSHRSQAQRGDRELDFEERAPPSRSRAGFGSGVGDSTARTAASSARIPPLGVAPLERSTSCSAGGA